MKKSNYRVVKVTMENGDVRWVIQKECNTLLTWLTGKTVWKYRDDDLDSILYWTRDIWSTKHYKTEQAAVSKLNDLVYIEGYEVKSTEVVKEVQG